MYDYMITYSPKDMVLSRRAVSRSRGTPVDDGLTWTFHIRAGVKWYDGDDLTAKDIAYTYSRIIDGGPESATWASYLLSVDRITAPDAKTVDLELKKPNAALPLLPIPIVPEHVWEKVSEKAVKSYSNEPESCDQPVVGSGPFMLVEGKADGPLYRFERNPNYWQGEPKAGEVDMQVYRSGHPDPGAQGRRDRLRRRCDALQVKKLEGDHDITAQNGDSPGFDEIAFNVGSIDTETGEPIGDPNPAVQDPKFRFALNFAIDREQIIDKAYQGAAEPAANIIPPAYTGFDWTPPSDDAFAYDPEKAKQLLDEAGYTVGDDGWRTMPGRCADRQAAAVRTLGLRVVRGHDDLLQGVAQGRRHRLEGTSSRAASSRT